MWTDILEHHGVKGQKWGVRRYQNKDGSLTSKGKMRYNVLDKGTKFNRISTVVERTPASARTYLTFTQDDADYYREHMTKFRRASNPNRKIYEMTYENAKKIVYPEHEAQVQEFVNLHKDKKVKLITAMADEAADRIAYDYGNRGDADYNNVYRQANKYFVQKYSNYSADEIPSKGYEEFIRTYSNVKVASLYQKRLKKKGYNAIIDENDTIYNQRDTINPSKSIIVFDPQKNLRIKGAKELSDKDYNEALERNKERRERKNAT